MKAHISLATAITLTGWSERTFWRRFADGTVEKNITTEKNVKAMVLLDSILPHLLFRLTNDEIQLVLAADDGNAQAQSDLAFLFLENSKPKESLYWLELAVKQGDASSMYWLGRAYVEGHGVLKDENLGMMWIAKAAAFGHFISQEQMKEIIQSFITLPTNSPQ